MMPRRLAPLLLAITVAAPAAAPPPVTLSGDGLVLAGGKRIAFGVPAAGAIAAVSAVLGKPVARGTYPDCGQGQPIAHVDYRGKLELSFIRGRFAGWTVGEGGDAAYRTRGGIGLGSTLTEAKRADPGASTDDGGESVMLVSEHGASGFLSGKGPRAKLVELHAGETCIVS